LETSQPSIARTTEEGWSGFWSCHGLLGSWSQRSACGSDDFRFADHPHEALGICIWPHGSETTVGRFLAGCL